MAYIRINDIQYERELLVLATECTVGVDKEQLSKEDMAQMFRWVKRGFGEIDIHLRTLDFIVHNFPATEEAHAYFEAQLAELETACSL